MTILTTKYGDVTWQQMQKALEIARDWHPAMNMVPLVEFVQQADRYGYELVRPLSKVKAGVPVEGVARAEVPLNADRASAKGHL